MFESQEEGYNYMQPQSMGGYETNQAVHLYRLNNQEITEYIEHQLKGEEKKKGEWIQTKTPWANDEGVNKIMSILSSVGLNKNITLGNLTHEEIYDRCRIIWQKLAYMMCVNYHLYGIDKSNRSMLIQLVIQQVHSSLSRSEMGREAKQLSTTTQHVEHTMREDKIPKANPFNPFSVLKR